jgi:hypothetical protein
MSPDQLAAIEARAQAATEGPWEMDEGSYHVYRGEDMICADLYTEPDAAFIAAARTDVPALLALVREQQAKLDRVRDTHKPFTHHFQSPPAGSIEVCHSCRESYPCPTIAAITAADRP